MCLGSCGMGLGNYVMEDGTGELGRDGSGEL